MINEKNHTWIVWTARILPLLFLTGAVVTALLSDRPLTPEALLAYTPRQPLLAALFLWGAFALKSLSMVFPVMLLFAVSGQLFPLPAAMAVNTVGIAVTLTVPWLLGRAADLDFTEKLLLRYPRLQRLRRMREQNGFLLSLLSRSVGLLPCDAVSLYFGCTRLPYPAYLGGAMLGFLPDLVCGTILGREIENVRAPAFWITLALNLLACAGSCVFFRLYQKKKGLA